MLEGCGYLAYTHLPYPPRTAVVLSDPVAAEAKADGGPLAVHGAGGRRGGGEEPADDIGSEDGGGSGGVGRVGSGGASARGSGGWQQLVVAFLEQHPRAIFVQVSERFGGLLRCVWSGCVTVGLLQFFSSSCRLTPKGGWLAIDFLPRSPT